MFNPTIFTVAVVVMFSIFNVSPAHCDDSDRKMVVKLEIAQREIKYGEVPKFKVEVKNISDKAIKVLNVNNRIDLQHAYCKIVLVSEENLSQLPEIISDPGPIDKDHDYLLIPAGGKVIFKIESLTVDARSLIPGNYKAQALFRFDPINAPLEKYQSQELKFRITKP